MGSVRMTNVNNEACSDLCILVTSQMVVGVPFDPQGSQFSVIFSVVRILWNVATILTVCYCMYLCMYVCIYVCMFCVTYCLYGCVDLICLRLIGFASPQIFIP